MKSSRRCSGPIWHRCGERKETGGPIGLGKNQRRSSHMRDSTWATQDLVGERGRQKVEGVGE